MKFKCPLRCGLSSLNKEDISAHVRMSKCPKMILLEGTYTFCEEDYHTLIFTNEKQNHCDKCKADCGLQKDAFKFIFNQTECQGRQDNCDMSINEICDNYYEDDTMFINKKQFSEKIITKDRPINFKEKIIKNFNENCQEERDLFEEFGEFFIN